MSFLRISTFFLVCICSDNANGVSTMYMYVLGFKYRGRLYHRDVSSLPRSQGLLNRPIVLHAFAKTLLASDLL